MGRIALGVVAATFAFVSDLAAQDTTVKPRGPRTLSGVVTDTLDNPLEDVDVLIIQLQRRVRTRSDGSFQFDSVKTGVYDQSWQFERHHWRYRVPCYGQC